MFSALVDVDRDEVVVVVSELWFEVTFDSEIRVAVEGIVSFAMVFKGINKKINARKKDILVFLR